MTDEVPAHHSAGHGGQVDLGLPFRLLHF